MVTRAKKIEEPLANLAALMELDMAAAELLPAERKEIKALAKVELRHAAQAYTSMCVSQLAELAMRGENGMIKIAAIRELLDRGWGKAVQPINSQVDGKLTISWLRPDGKAGEAIDITPSKE